MLSIVLISTTSWIPTVAAVKSGSACKKIGTTTTKNGQLLQCKNKSGKRIWVVKKVLSPPIQISDEKNPDTISPQPTPNPVPTLIKRMAQPATGISIYTGGPGQSTRTLAKSLEIPFALTTPPEDSNLKLWVYDPEDPRRALGSPGIFYQREDDDWKFLGGNSDGSIYALWRSGRYSIDTVEPNGRASDYLRKRYVLEIDNRGQVSVQGLERNSLGYFTVTATRNIPVIEPTRPKFTPTSACQLEDQTTNKRGMVGFPKRDYRLPSEGKINALIIPIDFSDVPGKGQPREIFAEMTNGTAKYFYDQSTGRVQFNFQTIENWVRAPFLSSAYELGKWNGGNSTGYFGAALALADPLVDYSRFDVVYVLSPREIPSSSIAYGPAFVTMPGDEYATTNEGLVANGSFSGADAWQQLPGAGWKWMAHETGHLFGLHDLYVVEGAAPYGSWDIMSLNWTTKAIALNAWNRYLLGWLDQEQVACMERTSLTSSIEVKMIPIERDVVGIKSAMVPLSSSKILVIESRRSEGVDKLDPLQEGILVYTVDMTIESIRGGWKTQRRPGSLAPDFMDATLKVGDKIDVEGVIIEVLSHDLSGDLIRVSGS